MKIATCRLKSLSAYSQNQQVNEPKLPKELSDDYEKRTYRQRLHSTPEGFVCIPAMSFGNSIKEAAKFLSLPIPGKGKSLFTKNFEAGVIVPEHVVLNIHKDSDQIIWDWVSVPVDGVRGGGKRVSKCFPVIAQWEATVVFYVLDDIITQDVFRQVLAASGNLIGIGRFRPRNWGYYGRFEIIDIQWNEM